MPKNSKTQKGSKDLSNLGAAVTEILSIDPNQFKFQLRFDDGEKLIVPLESVFSKPKGLAAEVLKGNLLSSCLVINGALAWPNGLELCADRLRQLANQAA